MRFRRFAFAVPFLVAIAIAIAAYASPLSYGDGMTSNMTRPCSYRGKTATTLSVTAASAATSVITPNSVVRVICTSAVHFRTAATSPTAVATDTLLPANTIEWFVSEGDYFAAIRDSADGTCYLTVCR
jgi:hypothetical protein